MSEEKEKRSDDYRIPNWAIGICLIMVVGATCYKFIETPITNIDFSDLLSLVLALFSIWLSVRFYRMADDASRDFYNNVFEFTSHTSEILGRIEERFGEKMERIGAGLRDVVERQNPQQSIINHEEEIKKKQEEQQQSEKEKQQLIEDFTAKAHMADKEKAEFIHKWNESEGNNRRLQEEILNLKRQIKAVMDEEDLTLLKNSISPKEMSFLQIVNELNKNYPLTETTGDRNKFMKSQPETVANLMRKGLVEHTGFLTPKGWSVLKEFTSENPSKGA